MDEVTKVDPKNLEIWLARFESFRPKDVYGTLATFDVVIDGLLEIKGFKLRKSPDRGLLLSTARLEKTGGFSVELRKWLGKKIRRLAIERLRAIAEHDLAILEGINTRVEELDEDADLPPHILGLDVASLPAQLMMAVR